MDTLMDKLAQKLNAQEMIRANGEAESEQMGLLRTQVSEYQGCLDRMQKVCNDLSNLETQIQTLALPQNDLSDEAIGKLKDQLSELTAKTNEQLEALSQSTEKQLQSMEEELLEKVSTEDAVHKECVRVYKNVQANIKEENDAQTQVILAEIKNVKKSLNGVKALAIIGVVFGFAAAAIAAISAFDLLSLIKF